MNNGYDEHAAINSQINMMLEAMPITKDNARGWLAFGRLLEADGHIIQEHAMAVLRAEGCYIQEKKKV